MTHNELKNAGFSDHLEKMEGHLYANFYDKKGNFLEKRDLGSNLIVNNAKLVMAHLLGQYASASVINGVKAFDPRITDSIVGRLNGGVSIAIPSWNPSASQLRPLYMGFGSNVFGVTPGANPSITDQGLWNIINQQGDGPTPTDTIASYLYGGNSGSPNDFVIQFIPNADSISDAWVRFITRMKTYQGQAPSGGASQVYQEEGLFTTPFISSTVGTSTDSCPILIARKTFPQITKTADLEIEFIHEVRF